MLSLLINGSHIPKLSVVNQHQSLHIRITTRAIQMFALAVFFVWLHGSLFVSPVHAGIPCHTAKGDSLHQVPDTLHLPLHPPEPLNIPEQDVRINRGKLQKWHDVKSVYPFRRVPMYNLV